MIQRNTVRYILFPGFCMFGIWPRILKVIITVWYHDVMSRMYENDKVAMKHYIHCERALTQLIQ